MSRFIRLSCILMWAVVSGTVLPAHAGEWDVLLDRLENGCRRLGDPPPKSMTAVEILKDLDGDGRPKSVTTVTKSVAFRDSTRTDSILNAVETKGGKTRDVTKEWIEKDAKEKAGRERKKGAKTKDEGKQDASYSMSSDDLFVFRKEIRDDYRFSWAKDTVIGGRSLRRITASPITPTEKRFFAEYVLSPDSTTVKFARLTPGKFPKMVKHMELSMRFIHDAEEHYFLDEFKMRFYASLIVKKIRMEITESYQDVLY
jgi:hypothetical protein